MYNRPLRTRQIQQSLMSESVVIRRRNQTRNRRGRTSEVFTEIPTRCSTEPLSQTDARVGALEASGTRLLEPREFFTIESIDVQNRDEIVWGGQRYIGYETEDFGEYSATIAGRKEGQS